MKICPKCRTAVLVFCTVCELAAGSLGFVGPDAPESRVDPNPPQLSYVISNSTAGQTVHLAAAGVGLTAGTASASVRSGTRD